jgi:arginyl-tRNA synthetase
MGALKFMLLKFNPKTTMMFDPQASVKFEGDTGPYVQYVCARISSIERKAADQNIEPSNNLDWSLADSEAEKALSATAFIYPQVLQLAAERKDCSGLVNYLLDLAKAFNRFYRECPVLISENSAEIRDIRLAICHRVRIILADGLKTLTIGTPQAM